MSTPDQEPVETPPTEPATDAAPVVGPPIETDTAAEQSQPKKKKKGLTIAAIIAGILVLGLIGGVVLAVKFMTPEQLKVGECVVTEKKAGNGETSFKKFSCDDKSKFTFKVAAVEKGDGMCQSEETQMYETMKARDFAGKVSQRYCLIYNLQKDKCYSFNEPYEEVACSNSKAMVKVADKLDGSDVKKCSTELAWGYPKLNVTYCLAEPK